MLQLLTPPAWVPPDRQPAHALPLTVPAALLVVLATQGGWMLRERLALIFWPDAPASDALHHLRINLHRSRGLLKAWGQADALQAERHRVQLCLPTDLALLRAAQTRLDADTLHRLSPSQWLQNWRLPGFEGFAQWCEHTGLQLHADWLAACKRAQNATAPATPAATPRATPTNSTAAPPGRDAELHRLLASPAPALLLCGEPGAGKSTLLHAAYPQALYLRGLEGLHGMPYQPLLDTLRGHTPTLARALREASHPLRPYRLDLARVLPELAPDEPLPPLDALTAQTRLVEALARAAEALTPVLLVDDLQWCDTATVEWLVLLAHSGRLRWRAAVRPHEITPQLAQAIQGLRSAVRLETLDLAPLSRAAVGQACLRFWPRDSFSEARLDKLHAVSGGNAFLLGELVAAGLGGEVADMAADAADAATETAASAPVQERVLQRVHPLIQQRLRSLPSLAGLAVQAAAVFVQPVPTLALRHMLSLPSPTGLGGPDEVLQQALQQATSAGLLHIAQSSPSPPSSHAHSQATALLSCRHDLIRQAVVAGMAAPRLATLHRHAALWLADQSGADADALTIAQHWRAAGEPQTALAWCHRGAEQQKSRGRFDDARALWQQVAEQSLDATQALRARLELAACDLFEDLQRGQAALAAVQAQLPAVADAEQHRQIESRVLTALVDNRVFAGDLAAASTHAQRLRELLPLLPVEEQINAVEVLIELAMRQPDIPGAWVLLAQLRQLAPRRPTVLSFEGQIHWFGGQCQAAHDALALLLARHPDYCCGITVENDLAVMLQALGRIEEAETMARRSLASWAGVAHTETLSLLVLGLVLTSAGRHEEADAALLRALQMARAQNSPGFEAEALVRRARLLLQCNRVAEAQAALDTAAPLLAHSPEPLRVSQLVLAQVQVQVQVQAKTQARAPSAASSDDDITSKMSGLLQHLLQRLQTAANSSTHPLVHVRLAQAQHLVAQAVGDGATALQAAQHMAHTARQAGLLEPLALALVLQAECAGATQARSGFEAGCKEALALATRQGFADVRGRAQAWLAARP
jgi:tetratricopeptide (TPR) repeat protein